MNHIEGFKSIVLLVIYYSNNHRQPIITISKITKCQMGENDNQNKSCHILQLR